MRTLTVRVGKTENNLSAIVEELDGFVCTADTFAELKDEVASGVEFHLEGLREDGDPIPEAFRGEYSFEFKFSTESLLNYYQGIFTNAALERITGINQKQLWHYAHGQKEPREETRLKISEALHRLGKELQQIEL
jgi:predicted RNase H-like HicB family nuclease